ncbi:hypothetical protein [Vulcanisaeta sp. JCM 16159]|uniref:hypothetical protein n=1 Tax=Vulcanisaeta sp. JCM 16159 TaxID=1295371 RepID=UPI0006D1ABFE|nr:hypothetical protein [Vulcanisaeta sp. JCM 16159]
MIPGVGIDIVHLMILKLVLHAIRETSRDDNANPLWLSLAGHISKATFYRRVSELEMMGLLERISRNKYLISIGGYLLLVFAYFMRINGIDEDTARAAISAIKGSWGLTDFNDYEVESYLRLLYLSSGGKLNSDAISLYQEFPRNVLLVLPNDLKLTNTDSLYEALVNEYGSADLINGARRVIAKALIEYFPTTNINGCRSVAFIGNDNRVRVLAMQCDNDYILN